MFYQEGEISMRNYRMKYFYGEKLVPVVFLRGSVASKFKYALGHSMMGMILWQLSYKAQNHVKVGRFFPSTKMCSCCGNVREEVPLNERTYVCPACGAVVDRDLNAAVNLMKSGVVNPGVPVDASASRCS